ncbi:hypothetical protein D3C75_602800 [compost metagenome]
MLAFNAVNQQVDHIRVSMQVVQHHHSPLGIFGGPGNGHHGAGSQVCGHNGLFDDMGDPVVIVGQLQLNVRTRLPDGGLQPQLALFADVGHVGGCGGGVSVDIALFIIFAEKLCIGFVNIHNVLIQYSLHLHVLGLVIHEEHGQLAGSRANRTVVGAGFVHHEADRSAGYVQINKVRVLFLDGGKIGLQILHLVDLLDGNIVFVHYILAVGEGFALSDFLVGGNGVQLALIPWRLQIERVELLLQTLPVFLHQGIQLQERTLGDVGGEAQPGGGENQVHLLAGIHHQLGFLLVVAGGDGLQGYGGVDFFLQIFVELLLDDGVILLGLAVIDNGYLIRVQLGRLGAGCGGSCAGRCAGGGAGGALRAASAAGQCGGQA